MIAYDTSSNSGYQTVQSTYSWNHTTTGAGSNRLMVVGVSMLSVAGSSVTSVTYKGLALTKIRHDASVSGAIRTELWYLANPPSGTYSVTVTLSTGLDSGAGAHTFTGCDQVAPIEANNGASATNVGAADATVNVTTVSNNAWVVDTTGSDDTAITIGAGQTSKYNTTGVLGSGVGSTEGPTATPSAVTMSWTNVAGLATWTISACVITPISGGIHSYPPFLRVGNGMSRSEGAT